MVVSLEQLLRVRYAYAGRFDAGGRHVVFVSDLGGVPQAWGVGERGWPELLVAPPDRAQAVYPGPRPGRLMVGADVGGNEHTQLLYAHAPGAAWRALTDRPDRIHNFGSFGADGNTISFAANTRNQRWFDVYVRGLGSDEPRCVLQHDSSNRAGPFSPDGRWLVVTRSFSTSHQELWLVDLVGSEPPRLLTSAGDEAVYQRPEWSPDGRTLYCSSDRERDLAAPARIDVATGQISFLVEPDVEVDETALDPTGRHLAYALNRGGEAEIVVRTLASGSEQTIAGLPPGALYAYWQNALAWDPSGERLAISWTASRASPNVFVWSAQGGTRQVTYAGGLEVDVRQLPEPQHVAYPTFDGRQIPAIFYPPASGAAGRPPCVVFVHGGPEGQYRPTFQPVVQYLAAAGFAVLAPNVRGSSGYGRTYMHLDDVRKRMDSVADLAHAVYWLRDTGRADPDRVAVYGGSYGGFMVLAALTAYPDLWAAGVDLVGIANFVTFLEHTGPWRRHLREAEYGSLERDRDFLEEISPIRRVERIRAPLLVIHGANDPRVPIGEAEQMVARLKALGRTVEFLRLEDEGHQIAKLKNKLVAYPLAVDFLRRHLMGEASSRSAAAE
jgi:dipeptidyl aminopeptidase/acylaminoacyl peptidase